MTHLREGQLAGDQERDRAERVRRPHAQVALMRRQVVVHRSERADVEQDRPDQLHYGRQPVDALGLPGRRPPADAVSARAEPVLDVDGLGVLEVSGRGEEQRADEEIHADPRSRRRGPLGGDRAGGEARRPDHEQHSHPPVALIGPPPHRLLLGSDSLVGASLPYVRSLAVPARLPAVLGAVGGAEHLAGDERAGSRRGHARPALRQIGIRAHSAMIPLTTSHTPTAVASPIATFREWSCPHSEARSTRLAAPCGLTA